MKSLAVLIIGLLDALRNILSPSESNDSRTKSVLSKTNNLTKIKWVI